LTAVRSTTKEAGPSETAAGDGSSRQHAGGRRAPPTKVPFVELSLPGPEIAVFGC
jgi:hypothetical protein